MNTNKKKHIYISHPISGYDLNERLEYSLMVKELVKNKFDDKEWRIMEPFDIAPYRDEYEYKDYMRDDLYVLYGSEIIVMCEDWFKSPGCRDEFYVAVNQQKTIYWIKNENDVRIIELMEESMIKDNLKLISEIALERNIKK